MITLPQVLRGIEDDVQALLSAPMLPLGRSNPPCRPGVYLLSVGDMVTYVGEAKGRKGLRDRLLSKHMSGDDGHAIQRAFAVEFPDRMLRREHIRSNVYVRWREIADPLRVSAVERALIWLFDPAWNKR